MSKKIPIKDRKIRFRGNKSLDHKPLNLTQINSDADAPWNRGKTHFEPAPSYEPTSETPILEPTTPETPGQPWYTSLGKKTRAAGASALKRVGATLNKTYHALPRPNGERMRKIANKGLAMGLGATLAFGSVASVNQYGKAFDTLREPVPIVQLADYAQLSFASSDTPAPSSTLDEIASNITAPMYADSLTEEVVKIGRPVIDFISEAAADITMLAEARAPMDDVQCYNIEDFTWKDEYKNCDELTFTLDAIDGKGFETPLQKAGVPGEYITTENIERSRKQSGFAFQDHIYVKKNIDGKAVWVLCDDVDGRSDFVPKGAKIQYHLDLDNPEPYAEYTKDAAGWMVNTPATAEHCMTDCDLETRTAAYERATHEHTANEQQAPHHTQHSIMPGRTTSAPHKTPYHKSHHKHEQHQTQHHTPTSAPETAHKELFVVEGYHPDRSAVRKRTEILQGPAGRFFGFYTDDARDRESFGISYFYDKETTELLGYNEKEQRVFRLEDFGAEAGIGFELNNKHRAGANETMVYGTIGIVTDTITDVGEPGGFMRGHGFGGQLSAVNITANNQYGGWNNWHGLQNDNYLYATAMGEAHLTFANAKTEDGLFDDYSLFRLGAGIKADVDRFSNGWHTDTDVYPGGFVFGDYVRKDYKDDGGYSRFAIRAQLGKDFGGSGPNKADWFASIPVTYTTMNENNRGWTFGGQANYTAFENGKDQFGILPVIRYNIGNVKETVDTEYKNACKSAFAWSKHAKCD